MGSGGPSGAGAVTEDDQVRRIPDDIVREEDKILFTSEDVRARI